MKRIKSLCRHNNTIALAVLVLVALLASCEKFVIESEELDPNAVYYFDSDVLPIIEKNNCASCHGGGIPPDLRSVNAYTSIVDGGYVNTANPESSKLYKQLINNSTHIPKTTPVEKQYILYWIKSGAKESKTK